MNLDIFGGTIYKQQTHLIKVFSTLCMVVTILQTTIFNSTEIITEINHRTLYFSPMLSNKHLLYQGL